MANARGTFEVKLTPESAPQAPDLGRLSIAKEYAGDLQASARGEMLTASTDVKGSAAYVAVERVHGLLHGRRGSFSLHHTGVMTRGVGELSIRIVPDSGTEELSGIAGTLSIAIDGGTHRYELDYSLGTQA